MADPVAGYHYVNNKIHGNADSTPDEEYPAYEMARDLAYMLLVAKSLIQYNGELAQIARTAEIRANEVSDEAAVSLLSKDMEIYELQQALKGPHEW